MKNFVKRGLSYLLVFAMALSLVVTSPGGVVSFKSEAASKKYVKALAVKKSVSVKVGEKVMVKPTVKVVKKANAGVTVKSANKNIATAAYSSKTKKITIVGKAAGSTTVKVTTVAKNKKGKKLTKSIKVSVANKEVAPAPAPAPAPQPQPTPEPTPEPTPAPQTVYVESVTVSAAELSMLKGEKSNLTVSVLPATATNKDVKWSSSPSGVVSLSPNDGGVVINAVAAGTATVTATAKDGSGKSAKCTVTVIGTAVVSTQAELDRVLRSTIGEITINGAEGTEFVITGSQSDKKLVLNSGTVTNNSNLSSVTINGGKYIEKSAGGNDITVTAPSEIKVAENATASIIINMPEASKENATDVVKIVNDGTLSQLDISSGGIVKVDGSATDVINTNISGENAKLITNQNMNLNLTAKADLIFRIAGLEDESGSTETTITVDKPDNKPNIYGVGQYEIKYKDGSATEQVMPEEDTELDPVDSISGLVKDAKSGDILEGVTVNLIPAAEYLDDSATASSNAVAKTTDDKGNYRFGTTKSGNYYMVMEKAGYKDAIQFLPISSVYKTDWVNETMEMIKTEDAVGINATIIGKVTDAATGTAIAGLTVELRRNKGITIGEPILTATTDEEGQYTLASGNAIEADQYTLRVVDKNESDDKYITKSVNICVKEDTVNAPQITTSKALSGEGIRFVLTWGTYETGAPRDLDSHMFGPRMTGKGMFHVSYEKEEYGFVDEDNLYTGLDVDDTSYEGPETITIYKSTKGIYYYSVHNYSGSPSFATSSAKVDIYAGSELLTTYNVPAGSTEDDKWWNVCSYNPKTKKITPINTFSKDCPYDEADCFTGYESLISSVDAPEGDGYLSRYKIINKYISLYITKMPTDVNDWLSKLEFTLSDSSYSVKSIDYDANEDENRAHLTVGNSAGDSTKYTVYLYIGCYVKGVAGVGVSGYYEDEDYLEVYYSDEYPESVTITCITGYRAEIAGDKVYIYDSKNNKVAEKSYYLYED